MNRLSVLILFTLFATLQFCTNSNNTEEVIIEEDGAKSNTAYLDSLIKLEPRNADLYYQRAKFYYNEGNSPRAIADMYSAMHLDSINADYYLLSGDLFIESGDINKAIALMSKGINLMPEQEVLYERAVEYNLYAKNHTSAINFANDLLELDKYNANAYFLKGLVYKDAQILDKAISTFQTCVEVDPEFYNAYMQLGLIYSKQNDDVAIQYFDNALRLQPKSREAAYGKAYHFQQKKDFNKAIANYKAMLKENPKDHELLFNIGHCYIALDSLNKAYKNFDIATKIQPQYTGAYYMKGYTSELLGNKEDALFNYKLALNLLPDDTTIQNAIKRVE